MPLWLLWVWTACCWTEAAAKQHLLAPSRLPGGADDTQATQSQQQQPRTVLRTSIAAPSSTETVSQTAASKQGYYAPDEAMPSHAPLRTPAEAEEQARAQAPLIDTFTIVYWSVAVLVWTSLCSWVAWHDAHAEDEESKILATEYIIPSQDGPGPKAAAGSGSVPLGRPSPGGGGGETVRGGVHRLFGGVGAQRSISTASTNENLGPVLTHAQSLESVAAEHFRSVELPRNLWAFLVVVALGQAHIHRRTFPRALAVMIAAMASAVQLSAVCLLTYDIDPRASPWTTDPEARWKTSGTSVNLMKAVQCIFLCAALVPEVGQSLSVFKAVFLVKGRKTLSLPPTLLIGMGCLQYLITMVTLFGGVSVVLSFQNTPDIIYSSMAITFISAADDTFYAFFEQLTDIQAEFVVTETVKVDENGRKENLSNQAIIAMKTLAVFPLVWAVYLLSRSWHTNVMPSERIRVVLKGIRSIFTFS